MTETNRSLRKDTAKSLQDVISVDYIVDSVRETYGQEAAAEFVEDLLCGVIIQR